MDGWLDAKAAGRDGYANYSLILPSMDASFAVVRLSGCPAVKGSKRDLKRQLDI